MNLRHVAALALVGWYLMVPPTVKRADGHYYTLYAEPLSSWWDEATFDLARECEQAKKEIAVQTSNKAKGSEAAVPVALSAPFAKCIGTDDPRLKERP